MTKEGVQQKKVTNMLEDFMKKQIPKDMYAQNVFVIEDYPKLLIKELYDEWGDKWKDEIFWDLSKKLREEYEAQLESESIKQTKYQLYNGIVLAILVGLLVNQITSLIFDAKMAIFVLVVLIVFLIACMYFNLKRNKIKELDKSVIREDKKNN